MNLLTDKLPENFEIDGTIFFINTDFRTWIKFETTMLDGRLDIKEKSVSLLTLCYKELPGTINEALSALMSFYIGTKPSQGGEAVEKRSKRPIYSFECDADYIYAAFMGQYGIDLQVADLHWWQFKALFRGLNDTNLISKIMEYRSMDIGQIKDRGQRRFYTKMQAIYRLPDLRSEEEKEHDMAEEISSLFR